ncbi:MAG: hypothetical protein ACOYT8_04000 [Candidatus Dependentiae bacterium]
MNIFFTLLAFLLFPFPYVISMEKNNTLQDELIPDVYLKGYIATLKHLVTKEENKQQFAELEKQIEEKKLAIKSLKKGFDESKASVFDKLTYLTTINTIGRELELLQRQYISWRTEISLFKQIMLTTLKKQNQQIRHKKHQ